MSLGFSLRGRERPGQSDTYYRITIVLLGRGEETGATKIILHSRKREEERERSKTGIGHRGQWWSDVLF